MIRTSSSVPFAVGRLRARRLVLRLSVGLPVLVLAGAASAQSAGVNLPPASIFGQGWTRDGTVASGLQPIDPEDFSTRFGDWLVTGGVDAGAVYNDNIFASESDRTGAWGVNFNPVARVERDTGIHRTLGYGGFAGNFFAGNSNANTYDARVGLLHEWEIQRDFNWRFQLEYGLETDYPGSPGQDRTKDAVDPTTTNSIYASTGAHKEFGRFFVDAGAEIDGAVYDQPSGTGTFSESGDTSGTNYNFAARAGYRVDDIVYTFVEPKLLIGSYDPGRFSSSGYRLVAGVGTERIGLFAGEVYGGLEQRDFNGAMFGTVTTPAFGGSVSWFPRRFLSFTLRGDQTISVSAPELSGYTNSGIARYASQVSKNSTVSLSGDFDMRRDVKLDAGVDFGFRDYVGIDRQDTQWGANLGATYLFREHWGLNLDYRYTDLSSTLDGASYRQNVVMLSARGQL